MRTHSHMYPHHSSTEKTLNMVSAVVTIAIGVALLFILMWSIDRSFPENYDRSALEMQTAGTQMPMDDITEDDADFAEEDLPADLNKANPLPTAPAEDYGSPVVPPAE